MKGSASIQTRIEPDDASLDFVAEENDVVEVEIQDDIVGHVAGKRLMKLYVSINGRTMLRIGRIPVDNLRSSTAFTS